MQAIDSPMIPALADAMPALGIWCLELEARGKGKAQDIEKAQEAGIRYNRQ